MVSKFFGCCILTCTLIFNIKKSDKKYHSLVVVGLGLISSNMKLKSLLSSLSIQ